MEYRMTPPPANASIEDLQKWMVSELQILEQIIATLQQQATNSNGG